MNRKIFFTILFLVFGNLLFAQQTSPVSTLKNLFQNVKGHQCEKAAALILYKGADEKRNLKDSFNYKNADEKKRVNRICRRISKYLKISDSYSIENSVTHNRQTGKYVVAVVFKSGTQALNINFEFVKSGEKFLLSDIK